MSDQVAIASALEEAEQPYGDHVNFYAWLRADYSRRREVLVQVLLAPPLLLSISIL